MCHAEAVNGRHEFGCEPRSRGTITEMKVLWIGGLLAISSALMLVPARGKKPTGHENESPQKPMLHDARTSSNDLELTGDVPGAFAYAGHYLSYSELLKLPQVTVTVTDDSNFPGKAEITGVYLDEVLHVFGIPGENTLIAAICDDGYEGHYSEEYRAAHHPILVLKLNGKELGLAKRMADGGSYGPYLVSHPSFTSRFITLSHPEEAQIPNGVLELRFEKEDDVFHAIELHGDFAVSSPQMQGYTIARQNCFRCHNAGEYGGRRSGISWGVLGKIATGKPAYFKAYIKDPEAANAYTEMPAFPDYNDATLAAITAYFQAIPANTGHK